MSAPNLNKHLTIPHAVALVVGMVVGAGYLVIPGIVYHTAGKAALSAWILNGMVIIPLLTIFARIGASHPSAEGLSGYFGIAFGRHAKHAMQILVLITFILAMPAIAIVGGEYASYVMHLDKNASFYVAALFFISAGFVNMQGIVISSRLQITLSLTLFTVLLLVAIGSLLYGEHSADSIHNLLTFQPTIFNNGSVLGTTFFAFIGWEMLSFTSEEFKNPKRDFPLALVISFLLVMVLYLGIAASIQLNLSASDPLLLSSPISALLLKVFGHGFAVALGCLAIVIVLANVNGAVLAVSRLVYASARSGLLPNQLSSLHSSSRVPSNAILAISLCFLGVLALVAIGLISQSVIFQIAGKTFFLIYLLSALAYFRLARKITEKLLGFVAILVCVGVASTYGSAVLFPLVILSLGWLWSAYKCKN